MDKQILIAQLVAFQSQLEAMHTQIQGVLLSLGVLEEEQPGCSHPADKRVNTTVQDGPSRFLCLVCNTEVSLQEKECD